MLMLQHMKSKKLKVKSCNHRIDIKSAARLSCSDAGALERSRVE